MENGILERSEDYVAIDKRFLYEILNQLKSINERLEKIEGSGVIGQNGEEEYLTAAEVMIKLKISRSTFQRLKNDGKILVSKIRGKLYIKKSHLQTILSKSIV
ncbi:MAG: hypothetical protein COC01_03945 [Bacteroidetes bacterium]|nr:MAG: hypothetical protein COC01_03945 [Bacteroidota bacterium]